MVNIEEMLKKANHVELHYGRYKIVNAVNGNWLILDRISGEYIKGTLGGNASYVKLERAIDKVESLNKPKMVYVADDPNWQLGEWEDFIKEQIAEHGRNTVL